MTALADRFPLNSAVTHVELPALGIGIVKGTRTTPPPEHGRPAAEWVDVKFPGMRLVTFYADKLQPADAD